MSRYSYKTNYSWNPNLAYCVGLIASDGSLSKSGRHIDFTTTDYELAGTYRSIIKPRAKIGTKKSGAGKPSYRVQVSDTGLYDFLLSINMTTDKSLSIGRLKIPSEYYRDFLRGVFDGDGSCYTYRDKRWKNSYMYYTTITSASTLFLDWLREKNQEMAGVSAGSLTLQSTKSRACRLSYAKADTLLLYKYIYYQKQIPHLGRKKQKLESFFTEQATP